MDQMRTKSPTRRPNAQKPSSQEKRQGGALANVGMRDCNDLERMCVTLCGEAVARSLPRPTRLLPLTDQQQQHQYGVCSVCVCASVPACAHVRVCGNGDSIAVASVVVGVDVGDSCGVSGYGCGCLRLRGSLALWLGLRNTPSPR